MEKQRIKEAVRERYASIAENSTSCCGPVSSCCSPDEQTMISKSIGYSDSDIGTVPNGANLGLGCGNPVALASLEKGETVLDLGSGAGFDCFLSAEKVGSEGRVIGVDMTHEMISKARSNAEKGGYSNVEFRLGEIEYLPAADNSIDVIISNCVINLSTDKDKVFMDAYRVLKSGGRIMVSDIVLQKPLPEKIMESMDAYSACISGAVPETEYLQIIHESGFRDVSVVGRSEMQIFDSELLVKKGDEEIKITKDNFLEYAGIVGKEPEELEEMMITASNYVSSISVTAEKP